jgi:hypothetical protein
MVAIGVRPCFDPQFGWTVMPVYAYVDCIGSGECVSVYEASSEVINGQTHYYHNLVLKYATGNETCPNEYMYLGVDESNPSLFRWYAVTCNYKCD